MKAVWSWTAVLLALIIGLGGCAPKTTQAPTPAPVAPQATLTPQPQVTPTVSPEEAAWQKVVEAAKKEGPLTIYSYNFMGDVGPAVSDAYTKRTGLKLDIVSGQTASSVEKVRTEHRMGAPVGSIVTGSVTVLLTLKNEGLTQKIGDLPELRNKTVARYDPVVDKEDQLLVVNESVYFPAINRKFVPVGSEPKAWKDLLKPDWKGKIGFLNPDLGAAVNATFYGLTSRGRLDQSYFKDLGKQDLRMMPNVSMQMEALARGETPFTFSTAANPMTPYLQQGVPLQAIDMAEGVVVIKGGSGLVWVAVSPQPNSAQVFINWFMSQDGQTVFQKAQGTHSYRNDVPDFTSEGARLTPANPIMWTLEDEPGAAQVLKDRVLQNLVSGK